jgi:cytochrome P450
MIDCSHKRAVEWGRAADLGKPVNITEQTSDFALELILVSIFGADYEEKLLAKGGNPFDFLSKDSTRDLSVVLKIRQLRTRLLEIISERRGSERDEFDFLSMYMQATDKEGKAFSDDELLDELMTLIVAGFETSANTLNWAWYLLARHEDIENQLLQEVQGFAAAVAETGAEQATAMVYTQQVLEETLRLYPPVWLFTRRSIEEDRLEPYGVNPGTDIYLSPYILHRTAHYWPDPDRFDPDRFALPEKSQDSSRKERPYFPFSLGPRRCLGEYFSFLEMKIHLAMLLPKFRLQSVNQEDPGLELGINLRSKRDIVLQPVRR